MKLPEDQPGIFELYLQWLYFGKIYYKNRHDDGEHETLVDAYIMGDKLLDTTFQDRVIDYVRTN